MTNYEAYKENKADKTKVWILFLCFGWSYGSLGQMGKQILYYLTFGGFGLWVLIRFFTLNESIRKYNKKVAANAGLTTDEMLKMGLL